MNQDNYTKIYEFLVQAARYWFVFLSIFIVYVAGINVFRDHRLRKKLNEDETVGELRALSGGGDTVVKNTIWEFTHEAMIGSARTCDVPITHDSVKPRHVLMKVEGDHILLRVISPDAETRINNRPYELGNYDLAYSGDRLKVGDVVLEVWLFGEEEVIEEDFKEDTPPKKKSKPAPKSSPAAKPSPAPKSSTGDKPMTRTERAGRKPTRPVKRVRTDEEE